MANEKVLKEAPGTKHDAGKLRLDLIDPMFEHWVGEVLTFGATRAGKDGTGYGDHNWAAGIQWSRLYGAIRRHINAWLRGEDLASDSGLPHLAHAACNIMFLLRHTTDPRYAHLDDRCKAFTESMFDIADLVEKEEPAQKPTCPTCKHYPKHGSRFPCSVCLQSPEHQLYEQQDFGGNSEAVNSPYKPSEPCKDCKYWQLSYTAHPCESCAFNKTNVIGGFDAFEPEGE